MTKVQLQLPLTRSIQDSDAEAVANAHAVYGIARVRIAPSHDGLTVDYDATRLSPKDVENWLIRLGLPVRRGQTEVSAS